MHPLARFGWLPRCTPAFRAFMLDHLQEHDVPAGKTLTHAGDADGGVYGLVAGQAAFVLTTSAAASGLSYFGFPGGWWGQGPLLGMPRVGYATARTDCRIGIVPLGLLRQHLARHPEHWEAIALGYSDLFLISAGAHADLLIPDHRRRLAATLLRLAGLRHRRFPVDAPSSFHCTQEELASAVGLSRNTIGRQLRAMEREGLVDARYGRLTLLDRPRLEALADTE